MKLVIFGATGRTGLPLVEQALAAGHDVTVFVRNPAKLTLKHPRLRVVQGDINNLPQIEAVINGQDAVLSALGPVGKEKNAVMAVSGRNIVAAMQKHGVKRLITVTGAGVSAPEDEPKLFNKVMSFLLKTTAGDVLADSQAHVDAIRASDLDWTVARVPVLADGPKTGKVRVGWVGKGTGARIVRGDVADFMLKQLADPTYVRKAPMISN